MTAPRSRLILDMACAVHSKSPQHCLGYHTSWQCQEHQEVLVCDWVQASKTGSCNQYTGQATNLFGRLDLGSAGEEHQAVLVCQHTAVGWIQMRLACAYVHDSTQHGLVEASACFAKGLTHEGGKHVLQITNCLPLIVCIALTGLSVNARYLLGMS